MDIVILPQELNDNYQSLKNDLSGIDGKIKKIQETKDEIKRRYSDAHDAQDIEVMLKGLDLQEQDIERSRKDWQENIANIEAKIKEVILGAHGKVVEWRTYNPNPVDKLGAVITTTYSLKDNHVVSDDVYDYLPVPERH